MKYNPIKKFWSKLMVASKAINTIPLEYLKYAQNARIYDWGIWPRRGKQLLTNSTLWTNNKGGFVMWDKLYQITNGKIYEINETTGVQTEIDDLWYDERTDILVYDYITESFDSLWTEIKNYSYGSWDVYGIKYNSVSNSLILLESDLVWTRDVIPLTTPNSGYFKPSVKISISGTTNAQAVWTGQLDWAWYILENWELMELTSGILSWTITLDVWYFSVTTNANALIASNNKPLNLFNGTTVTQVDSPINNGIIEYCRGYTFITSWNVLYISTPITPNNPSSAYNFTGTWSQRITYDTVIKGLKSTMNGLQVFTADKIEFLWANALQNVSWSATFISTPLWDGWELMDNQIVATSWDKMFYLTKNLNINTVNYVQGTAHPWLWELSNRPIIWVRELLQWIDIEQPTGYAFVNDNDNTVQFHLRTIWSPFNDVCIIYDMINDTWSVDTGKNYNYVVKKSEIYYGFSDINSSIYEDDVWFSDNGVAIQFLIRTQSTNLWTMQQKMFWWFFTTWGIWEITDLTYRARVDWDSVFEDQILWQDLQLSWIWEIAWDTIGTDSIWWDLWYVSTLNPFDFEADVGRIYQGWIRMDIEIESQSQIQDFIIDWLWIIAEQTPLVDIRNKF